MCAEEGRGVCVGGQERGVYDEGMIQVMVMRTQRGEWAGGDGQAPPTLVKLEMSSDEQCIY